MAFDYLAELNPEQRRAVEHGVKAGSADRARPLLVIAGAGTGKTKTLAHRVAHLIVNGISAHRILLLTFSRRAAVEMTRRVERITAAALGAGQADLPWSGTFHAIGSRLLRDSHALWSSGDPRLRHQNRTYNCCVGQQNQDEPVGFRVDPVCKALH